MIKLKLQILYWIAQTKSDVSKWVGFLAAGMKSYRKELWFEVPARRAFSNITPDGVRCWWKAVSEWTWCR
jgi:hypothetical protein